MNPLVKLVLVRHQEGGRGYLYEAPVTAGVVEGDTVICKTRNDEITYGIVVATTTIHLCSTEYRFIVTCADAITPLSRIIGKYEKIDFD